MRNEGESLAELAHDARNMVTALGLYCDLLEEPGVLATQFAHYGHELRLVAAASRRLVEELVLLDLRGNGSRGSAERRSGLRGNGLRPSALPGTPAGDGHTRPDPATPLATQEIVAGEDTARRAASTGTIPRAGLEPGSATSPAPHIDETRRWDLMPPELISNLARELISSRNLLSALAGPAIALTVDVEGGALPVRLNAEDLTRVMVNLVKNAAEAMTTGGSIQIGLRKRADQAEGGTGNAQLLSLTLEDDGPGIPRKALERIFEAGFTSHAPGNGAGASAASSAGSSWPSAHRGLGLSITRSIVEAAGGRIYATNREGPGTPGRGARFEIVLPVRSR
jgi:signal transduction histidine kinase